MGKRTGWGYFVQGSDQMLEIDELGSKLSLVIDWPVHFPAFGKNLFECKCGVVFPVYFLKGHSEAEIKEFHEKESRISLAQ